MNLYNRERETNLQAVVVSMDPNQCGTLKINHCVGREITPSFSLTDGNNLAVQEGTLGADFYVSILYLTTTLSNHVFPLSSNEA